jgi:hypothetical protein
MNITISVLNAVEVMDARITEDGRVYGLKKYAGHTVKIVVLEERRKK